MPAAALSKKEANPAIVGATVTIAESTATHMDNGTTPAYT